MDRRTFSLSLLWAAVTGLTGCGGGSGGAPAAATAELATATTLPAGTVFMQNGVATDSQSDMAPGQANYWDLDTDFTIADGGDDQFDGALQLSVQVGATTEDFPADQSYAELTAYGPELGAADGVKAVTFTDDPAWLVNGARTAILHPIPNARLQQTLDLTGVVPGHPLALTWAGTDNAYNNSFGDEPSYFQVAVRDTAGNLLETVYRWDNTGTTGIWGSASLDAYAGQSVVLSFEQGSAGYASSIDDVSLRDTVTNTQYVVNGDFEAGATGWTVPAPLVSQNVASGVRTVSGLQVQRFFFSQPNALWGRMTDVFANPGATDVTATIRYTTNLGSDGYGIIYATPGSNDKALTTWDGGTQDRNVGFVFGSASTVVYQSDSPMGTGSGDGYITVEFEVTVPAGASVTLVNFVVMTGADTGETAADETARASDVDAAAADIANAFRSNVAYQRGMTQSQLDTLKNF